MDDVLADIDAICIKLEALKEWGLLTQANRVKNFLEDLADSSHIAKAHVIPST